MQKTFCDRCGWEIPYGEAASVIYNNPENPCKREAVQFSFLLGPECFDLCSDCAQDFNVFMEGRPLREEEHAKEPTGSP